MKEIKVVLVDDDVLIRQSLKILLHSIESKLSVELNTFSSNNGVEGIGYTFIINPDVVIIDTTLPKYSGREMIEFLVTNPKFNNKLMFVLHDEVLPLNNLPSNYIVLNKRDKDFIHDFVILIERYVNNRNKSIDENLNVKDVIEVSKYPKPSRVLTLRKLLIQRTLTWANRGDRLMFLISDSKRKSEELRAKTNGKRLKPQNFAITILKLFRSILLSPLWLICQIFSSVYLTLLILVSPKVNDGNISQGREDILAFRVKAYPTLAGVIVSLAFLLIQFLIFVAGGIIILNTVKVESVFADTSSQIKLNLDESTYDLNSIVFQEGRLRLKPQVGGLNSEIYTPKPIVVELDQNIVFSELIQIYEESSINNKNSSVDYPTQSLKYLTSRISYQLSPNGSDWFIYLFDYENPTKSSWYKTGDIVGSNIQELNWGLKQYHDQVGGNAIYIRMILKSNGYSQIEIESLEIDRKVYLIDKHNKVKNNAKQLDSADLF